MSKIEKPEIENRDKRRTKVTFTKSEYRKVYRKHLETGKSIQALLKEAFAKNPLPPPTLSQEEQAVVLREVTSLRVKSDELVQLMNSGDISALEAGIKEFKDRMRTLFSFLGLSYEGK